MLETGGFGRRILSERLLVKADRKHREREWEGTPFFKQTKVLLTEGLEDLTVKVERM